MVRITIKKRNDAGEEKEIILLGEIKKLGSLTVASELLLDMEQEANASGRIRVWIEEVR